MVNSFVTSEDAFYVWNSKKSINTEHWVKKSQDPNKMSSLNFHYYSTVCIYRE